MATFLDTLGVLDFFAPVLTAVLVFTLVFALLTKTKLLGGNKVVDSLVAIVLGLLILLIPDVVDLVNFMAPWFVLMVVFIVLLLLLYQMFGLTDHDISHFMLNDRVVNWALFAVGIIIFATAIFNVYGQRALEATTATGEGFESNLFSIIFNSKVLGLMLIFTIAIFTVAFLGGGGTSEGGGGGHH